MTLSVVKDKHSSFLECAEQVLNRAAPQLERWRCYQINQSINQTFIVPISPAKPGSVVGTAESMFNSKIEETVP